MLCIGGCMPKEQENQEGLSEQHAWSSRLRRKSRVNYGDQLSSSASSAISRTVKGGVVRYEQSLGKTPSPLRKRNYDDASRLTMASPGGKTLFSTVRRTRPYRVMCQVEIIEGDEVVSKTRLYQSHVQPSDFYQPRSTPKTARASSRVAQMLKPSDQLVKSIEAQVSHEMVMQAKRSMRNTKRMLGASAHEIYKLHGIPIDTHVEINHLWAHRYGGDTLPLADQHQIAFAASAALNTLTLIAVESPMAPYIMKDTGAFTFKAQVGVRANEAGQSSHIAKGDMQCIWTSPAGVSVRITMDTQNPYVSCKELSEAVNTLYNSAFSDDAEAPEVRKLAF